MVLSTGGFVAPRSSTKEVQDEEAVSEDELADFCLSIYLSPSTSKGHNARPTAVAVVVGVVVTPLGEVTPD